MAASDLQRVIETASARARHEVERFQAETAFAESLCELHPDQAVDWQPLLAKARELVSEAVAEGGVDGLEKVVRAAETILTPIADTAKTYTVHCVGHAHIDMNWMWSWPETVAVTNDTFSTVLRLMEEYPDFRFSQSQASVYAICEEYNPSLLERIAERVKEGRWEVTASHWVEGDKNLAGGESLCRHLLYTRQYMQKLFGLSPEDVNIDWSPDTFGHAVTVPTYLVRGGIKYLYLHRPGVHGPKRPQAFWWQAPDGSRVLVRNDMALGYNGQIGPQVAQLLVNFTKETGCPALMFVYGVGDHGGGPTRRDLLRAQDMMTWPIFPAIRFSTVRTFYEILEQTGSKLPTLECELNTEFTGCYTTESLIKKANRYGENRLLDAEAAASVAWAALGRPYPADGLREAWQDTLFSHFHDILPGSGVHDTRTYCHGTYQKTMARTSMVETEALRALAARIDTSHAGGEEPSDVPASYVASGLGAGVGYASADGQMSQAERSIGHGARPFVVFNPTAWDRSEVVEATVWDNAPPGAAKPIEQRTFAVATPEGSLVPAQPVNNGGYWGHQFVTLAFPASAPGVGYASYTVVEQAAAAPASEAWQLGRTHHCRYSFYERSPEGLENDLVRLEVDPCTGGIRSLMDKRSETTVIGPSDLASILEYAVERPHGMTAWLVDHTGPVEHPEATAIRRKLDGPHKASIEVDLCIHESQLTLTYELRAGDPRVYLHLQGTWFQRGTRDTGVPVLRLALPLALTDIRAQYEVPFGAVDRALPTGEEVPALEWAQVTGDAGGKNGGCLLINDSKHGHSIDGSTLRLTLIRSSYEPDPLPEIGNHEIHLALLPFGGDLSVAEATRYARDLNHSLRAVGTDVHEGDLPAQARLLSVGPENVIVSGIKKAEDSDELVVRLYETEGKETTAEVTVNAETLGQVTAVRETDLLERATTDGADADAGVVRVAVPARGITTVSINAGR